MLNIKKTAIIMLLALAFLACLAPASAGAAKQPKDLRLERSAIYYGEERDLMVNVELSSQEYLYLFLETPGGRFLDDRGREYRQPVIFGVFGPARNARCRIDPALFDPGATGIYNIYAVQHPSRQSEAEDLKIKSWEDLYDLSLQATLDVVGPYSASVSTLTLESQGVDAVRRAELSISFQADNVGRMRGVPPHDTDGRQRLYIDSNRSSETARLEACTWENGWVNVQAEVSGSDLRYGVNIFDLDWTDSRGRSYDTIYTFDDGSIHISLTTEDPGEVVLRAARDDRFSALLRGGKQTIDFLQYDLEEIYLDLRRYASRAGERFELTALLWDSDLNLEGIEVVFQERRDGGNWRTIGRANTDPYGRAVWEISREIAGSYEYRAEALGVETNIVEKLIVAGATYEVKPQESRVNVIAEHEQKIRIHYLDRYENSINAQTLDYLHQKPEDVMDVTLTAPGREEISTARLLGVDEDGLYLKYDFPIEGIYQLEAFIKGTGISATCEVHAYLLDDDYKLVLETEQEYIRSRQRSLAAAQDLLDEGEDLPEATKLTVTAIGGRGNKIKFGGKKLLFSMDKGEMATVYHGQESWLIADSGVSGELEIIAYHKESGLNDSLTITISGEPWYLDADVEIAGRRATVVLTHLDKDGKPSAVLDEDEMGYTVVTPAGLTVSSQEDFRKGSAQASFVVEALQEDTFEVHVFADTGISGIVEIDFAHLPAQEVKMYIGATRYLTDGKEATMDMAPFIQSERTFVPVRFIAQAFGVEEDDIKWEPKAGPVREVFIPYENKLVTITIGSETIRVLDNGELKQVKSDAAAFICDGRTVLPLRAIGEIFGARFDWGPKVGATEWVSFKL